MSCCSCLSNPRFSNLFKFLSGAVLITTVAAIFGGYSVMSSVVFHGSTLNPLVYAFLRDCVGTTALLGAAIFMERGKKREDGSPSWMMDPADFGKFVLLGLTGVYGSQAMSALTIKYTTASFFSSLSNLQPIVTTLYAILLGLERFHFREPTSLGKITGMVVTVSSAIALVLLSSNGGAGDVQSQSINFGLGLFYLALQILLGGGLSVVQKPMFKKYSPIMLAGNGYLVGTGILLICVIVACPRPEDWDINAQAIAGIAYAGILSSGVAYALMAYINNKLGPTFVAAFLPTQALWAALFGYIFQGKTLPALGLMCAALMIVGVLVIVLSQYRESKLGLLSPFAIKNSEAALAKGSADAGVDASLNKRLLGDPEADPILFAQHSPVTQTGGAAATTIDLPAAIQRDDEDSVKAWR